MTSQMEGDQALAEHRAVMAALLMDNIRRPTLDQYEAQLDLLRKELSECPVTTRQFSSSSAPSQSA
jgi:hypothetical protein